LTLNEASSAYQAALEHVRAARGRLPREVVIELEQDRYKAKLELDRVWYIEHGIDWL
jgi:hypothetical protein